MNRHVLVPLALVATVAIAQDVGTIRTVEGTVLVNQGEQFVAVRPGQAIKASDRVMAVDGGSATIRYSDGCDLAIASGTLVTLPSTSPCAGGVPLVQNATPGSGEALGAAGSAGTGGSAATVAWIAGGVLIGAAVYELVEDDDDTVSP